MPLVVGESLLVAPLPIIDEVPPVSATDGFGCSAGAGPDCFGVLRLLTVVALEPPMLDDKDDIPRACSSEDLRAVSVGDSGLPPTLTLVRSLCVGAPEVTVAVVLVTGLVLLKEGGVEEVDEPPRIGG